MLRFVLVFVALAGAHLTAPAQQPAPVPPPAPSPVQPAIKLPDKVATPTNKVGKITVEGTAKTVKWVTLTPGLSIEATADGRTLYYTGAAGSYDLIAYCAVGDVPSDPVRVTVVIADPTPPAPPPAPVPPPAPPAPSPPADPLKAKLQAAFASAAGTKAQKADWAKDLAALYRASTKIAADPTVTTAAALKTKLGAAADLLVGTTALKEVRVAVKAELVALLPATDAPLTDDQREAAAALFTRLAPLVEALGQ